MAVPYPLLHTLDRLQAARRCGDFKAFHFKQAVGYQKRQAEQNGPTGRGKLSNVTNATLAQPMRLFQWLARPSGYESSLNHSDVVYFDPSKPRGSATPPFESSALHLQEDGSLEARIAMD